MMTLFGENWETAAVIGQSLISVALGYLVYSLACRISQSSSAGFFALALYLSNFLFQFEITAKRETTLFTVLLLIFFHVALFTPNLSKRYMLMALSAALAFLLRPNAVALLPVGLFVLYLDRKSPQFSLLKPVLAGLLFLAVIYPWQSFVYQHSGTFPITTSTNSGQTLWKGNNPYLLSVWPKADIDIIEEEMTRQIGGVDITTAAGDSLLKQAAVEFIKQHPQLSLRNAFIKAGLFFFPVPIPMGEGQIEVSGETAKFTKYRYRNILLLALATLHSVIMIGGCLGFMFQARDADETRKRVALLVLILTVLLVALHSLTYPESRYRWPLDIVWTVLAGCYLSKLIGSKFSGLLCKKKPQS